MQVPGAWGGQALLAAFSSAWGANKPSPRRAALRCRLAAARDGAHATRRCRSGRAGVRPPAGRRATGMASLLAPPPARSRCEGGSPARSTHRPQHDDSSPSWTSPSSSTTPMRAAVSHDDPVDERGRAHDEVGTRAARVEVGERSVPARAVDDVRREGSTPTGWSGRSGRPGAGTRAPAPPRRTPGATGWAVRVRGAPVGASRARDEVGREALVRPARAPFVVVRARALGDHARVHGGRAAEDPSAECPSVVLPAPRGASVAIRAGVEDLRRPAVRPRGPVVRTRLQQADAPVGVLAECERQHATCRPATDDDHVEAHGPRIGAGVPWPGIALGHPLAAHEDLVRARVRRADARAAARLAGDRERRTRAHPGADGLREDARGVPARHRPPERDARGRPAPSLRLAAQGAELRHRAEPAKPARRARLEALGRRAHGRHACRRSGAECSGRLPDILITTPESLFLLLTSQARETLRGIETVILDEVHAVAGTKRGAHLALSLERLERLVDAPFQRLGLSATQRPMEEIGRFVAGSGREIQLVDVGVRKELDLQVVVPVEDMRELPLDGRALRPAARGRGRDGRRRRALEQVDLALDLPGDPRPRQGSTARRSSS